MGQRERLQGRPRPTADCKIKVDDTAQQDRELAAAAADLQLLILTGADLQARDQARSRLDAAQAALDACFETVICTALPPDEFEDLVTAHKPREDHPLDEAWNVDTFPPACFLACAPLEVFSREEWEEWLETQVNDGERTLLYNTALTANLRVPDASVPKGLSEILS